MDILSADDMKKDIRIFLWLIRRKLKKEYGINMEDMRKDLENAGNPVISLLWEEIKSDAEKIKETYQKEMVLDIPMIALWIIYRDSAYTNPFMYIIKQILDKKEELMPFVMKYYKEPEDWYVNRWHDSKVHTAEMKAKGELPKLQGVMSLDEEIFVPRYQQEKIEILDKQLKKIKESLIFGETDLKNVD